MSVSHQTIFKQPKGSCWALIRPLSFSRRRQAIVVRLSLLLGSHCQAIIIRLSQLFRSHKVVFMGFLPQAVVQSSSGRHRQAIVVRPSLSGRLYQANVMLSSSGHCCQAIVVGQSLSGNQCQAIIVRPSWSGQHQAVIVRPTLGCHRQAIVVRPLSSGHRRRAIVVRPSLLGSHCQVIIVRPSSSGQFQAVIIRPLSSGHCFRPTLSRRPQAIVVRLSQLLGSHQACVVRQLLGSHEVIIRPSLSDRLHQANLKVVIVRPSSSGRRCCRAVIRLAQSSSCWEVKRPSSGRIIIVFYFLEIAQTNILHNMKSVSHSLITLL